MRGTPLDAWISLDLVHFDQLYSSHESRVGVRQVFRRLRVQINHFHGVGEVGT